MSDFIPNTRSKVTVKPMPTECPKKAKLVENLLTGIDPALPGSDKTVRTTYRRKRIVNIEESQEGEKS